MASKRIPSLVAFKAPNNKYLGYSKHGECRGHLKFCYDDLMSPFVKHEIVEAGNGCVHIKCCYNNRYWRNREDLGKIAAGEYLPNSDLSSESCTLFDLKYEDTASNKVSLRLPQNKYVVYKEYSELEGYPFAGEPNKLDKNGSFTLYDVGSLVRLPKFLAFKGDNGRYLALDAQTSPFLRFSSSDLGDNSVRQQVDDIGDGDVSIKNLLSGTFWTRRADNYIEVGSLPTATTFFRPIQIDAHTVALRCLSNSKIIKRFTDRLEHALSAIASSLEETTFLTVVETVFSRRVHSIVYDLDNAHIYDLEPLVLARGTAANNSGQSATLEMGLEYTERRASSWSNSNSFMTGVSATFTAGIPFIAKTEIEVSVANTFTWEWGEEEERSTTISTKYIAVVEAGKSVEVLIQATRARCDVKFSYVQEDLLTTGERVLISSEDGVFKGMNYTDIRVVSHESQIAAV